MAEVKQTTTKKETVTAKTTETKKVETKKPETKAEAPKNVAAKNVAPKKTETVKATSVKKETAPKVAPKTTTATPVVKKEAAKKPIAVKKVKETIETLKVKAVDAERAYLVQKAQEIDNIQKDQFDATSEHIIDALTTLSQQLSVARAKGSVKAKEIVDGFGGEGRMNDLITDLAGYMGEIAGAGAAVTTTPLVVMAGAAKGIYKKVID